MKSRSSKKTRFEKSESKAEPLVRHSRLIGAIALYPAQQQQDDDD